MTVRATSWTIPLKWIIRLPILVLAFGILGLEAAPLATGEEAGDLEFRWTSRCGYTRSAQVDPIVSPGQPSMHLHDFFGTSPDENATLGNLQSADSTCSLKEDTAGYWVPSLYTKNSRGVYVQRVPSHIDAYYSVPAEASERVEPFPPNLKVVAGDGNAAPASQSLRRVWFDCGPGSGPWSRAAVSPYLCPKDKHVRAHVRFPSCWDGVAPAPIGNDSAHMAYPVRGACAAGWVTVPQIHMSVNYEIRDGRGARLSSGGGSGNPNSIYTFHADYFHSWDQIVHAQLIEACLRPVEGSCRVPRSPSIKEMAPTSAPVGASVTLSGRHFTGASSVTFNGVPASFSVGSDRSITAIVPRGAGSGPIAVTSDGGTGMAVTTNGYSSVPFTVT